MNGIVKLVFLFLFFSFSIYGQVKTEQIEENNSADTIALNESLKSDSVNNILTNNAFTTGEYLKFNIKYGFIHAGSATMHVIKRYNYNDKDCFLIKTTARSARGFEWIFKVRDTVTTTFDAKKFHSLKFIKKLREGSYYYDLITEYDQINGKAYVERTRYYDREATRIKKQKFLEL
ncbi:MAG: DUF3108 domain-containing protein, partial [Calditrichia bacterium]|nr:DUF3108 domain-containing protein [Calditrichia bacterium]